MKKLLALGVLVAALSIPAAATARTWITSYWNGHQITYDYVHHPSKAGFLISRAGDYWLLKDLHWHGWGHSKATANGKLASAALDGTPVHVVAHRKTYRNCRRPGDTVHFYVRVKIRIAGEHGYRHIPRGSMVPQCNNP